MSSHFWCHGPSCHTYATQDRVRGSKGSKVLRTRKIKQHHNDYYDVNCAWNYFCSQGCQNDFWRAHGNAIRQIAPRLEPLETPINDPEKKTYQSSYGDYSYTRTTITKIDTDSNVG
jgi:hypothetical protein